MQSATEIHSECLVIMLVPDGVRMPLMYIYDAHCLLCMSSLQLVQMSTLVLRWWFVGSVEIFTRHSTSLWEQLPCSSGCVAAYR